MPALISASTASREISVKPPSSTARLRLWVDAVSSVGSSGDAPASERAAAATARVPDAYQHVSLPGTVCELRDNPDLKVMDRLSMRYIGEPWPERQPCVSVLVAIDRWHSYGLLSDSSDYSSRWAGRPDKGVERDPLALGCLNRSLHAFGSLDPQAGSL